MIFATHDYAGTKLYCTICSLRGPAGGVAAVLVNGSEHEDFNGMQDACEPCIRSLRINGATVVEQEPPEQRNTPEPAP